MAERRVDGFFYGLFMDTELLSQSQITASNPRRAYLDGFALHIGRRATLVPTPGGRAYGMVFALTHADLAKLYNAPGLEDYRPEAVQVQIMEGETLPALCYNLLDEPSPDEANSEYAARLKAVLTKLGFPLEYIDALGENRDID